MKQRNYDVMKLAIFTGALLVMAALALAPGCKAMDKYLPVAAAATTQASNDPVVKLGAGMVPWGREILEAAGLVATAYLAHRKGKAAGVAATTNLESATGV